MPAASRGRRESRRGPSKSYRIEELFPTLDSDDSEAAGTLNSGDNAEQGEADEEEDPDDFRPEEADEDPDDDVLEDVVDEVDDLRSDDDSFEESVAHRGDNIIEVDYEDDENGANENTRKTSEFARQQNTAPAKNAKNAKPASQAKKQEPRKKKPIRMAPLARVPIKAIGLEKMHARGTSVFGRGGGLELRIKDLFGPTKKDIMPIIRTRDYWDFQETLPSREGGSLRRSFHLTEGAREREIEQVTKWYSETGRARFADGQRTSSLSREDGMKYMVNSSPVSMNVLMGNANDPQLYIMKKGSFLSTAIPFDSSEAKAGRRGWIFNLGSRIQESQWTANEEGSTQYLAVAVEQEKMTGRKFKPLENPKAPAYSATEQFPASIQIWAFDATEKDEINPESPPRLELVICTDWGVPKRLKWCPIAVTKSPDGEDTIHLGLLAGLWSDGRVRILDISYRKLNSNSFETQFIHYSRAAFDAQVPLTIPTCLHWLSPTSIAVATASGALGIWTLTRPETFRPPGLSCYNPQPWFYQKIADTYVLTLTSGYPSRPNYISYTTTDGFAKLIDLRSPLIDACSAQRGRSLCLTQAWHEHTQAFVMADDHYMLRSNAIRRYYTGICSMRMDNPIGCCATSPVQPAILVGTVDGLVQASNPIMRLLNEKELPWQQTWFKHEWRPSVDKLPLKIADDQSKEQEDEEMPNQSGDSTRTTTGSEHPTLVTEISSSNGSRIHSSRPKVTPEVIVQPLSRMTEGYKIEHINLAASKPTDTHTVGGKWITIFEEPSAITTVAWNPNLRFGTWAVAGMGDGLLRVEDLDV